MGSNETAPATPDTESKSRKWKMLAGVLGILIGIGSGVGGYLKFRKGSSAADGHGGAGDSHHAAARKDDAKGHGDHDNGHGHGSAGDESRAKANDDHLSAPEHDAAHDPSNATTLGVTAAALHGSATGAGEGWFGRLVGAYAGLFHSIRRKVDTLHRADSENYRLRLENAYLRTYVENKKFECTSKASAKRTQELKMDLSQETNSAIGRTLASINYKPPTHMLPANLFNLAMSYFTSGQPEDTEKVAVILTLLTNLEGNDAYKTPRDYLMAGVAWYRLDNFALAREYFDRILKAPKDSETEGLHAQARLWNGITSERSFKHGASQEWLKELMNYHPHSQEAKWVNVLDEEETDAPTH